MTPRHSQRSTRARERGAAVKSCSLPPSRSSSPRAHGVSLISLHGEPNLPRDNDGSGSKAGGAIRANRGSGKRGANEERESSRQKQSSIGERREGAAISASERWAPPCGRVLSNANAAQNRICAAARPFSGLLNRHNFRSELLDVTSVGRARRSALPNIKPRARRRLAARHCRGPLRLLVAPPLIRDYALASTLARVGALPPLRLWSLPPS